MNMDKKHKVMIVILSILNVAVLLVGVSYAYYVATISGNETSKSLEGTSSNLEITFADGADTVSASGIAPGWSATKTFTVTNTGNDTAYYKIKVYDLTNTFTVKDLWDYTGFSSITYSLTSTGGANTPESSLPTTDSFASVSTSIAKNVTHTYTMTINYKTFANVDQTADMGKTFSFKIGIVADNNPTVYAKKGNASDSIKALAGLTSGSGGVKSISQGATTQLRATTEYRYYGANPNNYVTFNGELWRIIGVFETENESGTLEYRVKLIRNESIGSYSWDTSADAVNSGWGINEWSQSDLMKLLNPGYESNQDLNNSGTNITVNNSLYWTKGSGTCYSGQSNATTSCDFTSTGLGTEAKSMIDKAKFYTSGWNTSSITSNQFYTYERGSAVISSPSDGITRTTSWVGYIGLMYLSDYGYATDESLCASRTLFDYDITSCYTNDWLWRSVYFYWSIIPNLSESSSVWIVSGAGEASSNHTSINYYAGKPVLYLKSNVQITGGEGSSTNPYTLAI